LKRANLRRKWSTIPKAAPDPTKQQHFTIIRHDSRGRTIFVADAHRGDGKRFIVRADDKLTAFVELEAAVHACGELA
jgi:hypothetical protein